VDIPLPAGLRDRLAGLAARLGVPADAPLLGAAVRVVSLLTGEPLPDGSWADLVRAVAAGTATLPAEVGFGTPTGGAALTVEPGSPPRLHYRIDLFDAGHARRVGGYLVRALEAMADRPDRGHAALGALSADERHHQLRVLGRGAPRALPDRRFHELFAERARRQPDAVAAVHCGASWSYGRLDRRANQIANALLAAGLSTEDVVAVATERHLDWLAAVIGVLKAGGAYLPVEPSFPPARVATLLARSGCAVVLTDEPGAAAASDVDAVRRLPLAATAAYPSDDPAVAVTPDRLAYIYFTSGSTGLPKGAMCEHLGMLNHLLAKVDDLGLGPGDAVVQNAQQSFDISLWQLLAPLLAGGRTLIVDRDAALHPARFLDTLAAQGATVLQVVPSYLDILLQQASHRPPDLGALRVVSVTGEAISKALVSRWFAAYPSIPLVNAYGATEASDDTTHEVLTGPPPGELVPVGRPVSNVTVYVLGPDGSLLPLGSVGEIAFSGICVGRGYVNDPERTAEAFGPDPWRPGVRMYRTGDFGRWLPSGSLEFHGRRDDQVKVHGVRIELGEVRNRVLDHPRVAHATVVAVPEAGGGKTLAAFYTDRPGAVPLTADELRGHLAGVLPASAVPARLFRVDALPLNENGKVDRKALVALAAAPTGPSPSAAAEPRTPTERRIAEVWAQALHRPVGEIGSDDHFFELGGTSLSALRVVATLDGLVSLDDMLRTPVLRALAAAADGGGTPAGGLLRLLAGEPDGAIGVLVCLPYAAGTALDFRPLAAAVAARDPAIAVYAVQPPGHDPTRPGERPLDVARLAEAVAAEIAATVAAPTVLWGHCTGAVAALETARRLEQAGRPAVHAVLAALLHEDDDALARQDAALGAARDDELARRLTGSGLTGLADRDLAFVGRVYRHDTRAANEYLGAAGRHWNGHRLATPVTVAVSTSDPLTAGYGRRFGDWARFAGRVRLCLVDGGGHYFARTRAARCADEVVGLFRATVTPGGPS